MYNISNSILPATQCLFGKLKVTLAEIAKQWSDNDILICSRDNGFGKKPTIVFVCGSSSEKLGDKFYAVHDQSFAKYGEHTVIGKISYITENMIPVYKNVETVDALKLNVFDLKAPVFVFK